MKTRELLRKLSVLGAASIIVVLSACSGDVAQTATPTPEKDNLVVNIFVDGDPFSPEQNLDFSALHPNQKQIKKLTITNEGNVDALVTTLDIAETGNIFDNGAVTIDIVTPDKKPISGTVIAVGETVKAKIVLITKDDLGSGLTGTISLDFKTKSAPSASEETKKKEDNK